MRRLHLFEWEDQPWFPHVWRNCMTDLLRHSFTLAAPWARGTPGVQATLHRLLDAAGSDQIVDLCSGSSGPLLWFRRRLEEQRGRPVTVTLTDKFPNVAAFEALARTAPDRVNFRRESVDATTVPAELSGARTMFLALHHFPPELVQRILSDAARQGRPLGVFDIGRRSALSALAVVIVGPLVALTLTPFIRPFAWSRLLWTYVLPVVPFGVTWDGVVSCLRAYTHDELRAIAAGASAPDYTWEVGYAPAKGGLGAVTCVVGLPRRN